MSASPSTPCRTHARPHERACSPKPTSLRPPHRNGRINGDFPQDRRCFNHRANDVTNPPPAAINRAHLRHAILDVDKAHTVMVIKRGMSPGFAGIDNPLYYLDRTLMLFGTRSSLWRNCAGAEWRTLGTHVHTQKCHLEQRPIRFNESDCGAEGPLAARQRGSIKAFLERATPLASQVRPTGELLEMPE